MDIEAFRASHAAFPLDANSRALLNHLASFGELDCEIGDHDFAIHIYSKPLAFILEGPGGFAYEWMQGGDPPAPSLAEAEAALFAASL